MLRFRGVGQIRDIEVGQIKVSKSANSALRLSWVFSGIAAAAACASCAASAATSVHSNRKRLAAASIIVPSPAASTGPNLSRAARCFTSLMKNSSVSTSACNTMNLPIVLWSG